jgi:1-hydroxycarotenoid 3,4-desaturase
MLSAQPAVNAGRQEGARRVRERHVAIIGAGVGGLAAAITLAARGIRVSVLERAPTPGGKLRTLAPAGLATDSGPTVFTMAWVFEELFAEAGTTLADHVTLRPVATLARHAWADGTRFDLFADIAASADAIAARFGAREAAGYRAFCARAREVFASLRDSFLRAEQPGQVELVRRAGLAGLGTFLRTSPFSTLWDALGSHFREPKLRQLFGRYATYCGSSPFAAPATLMLVAHVEQDGVWLVEGGMHRIATAMADLAQARGATVRYGTEVTAIEVAAGRATGVRLADGEVIAADAVLANCDAAAIGAGLFGRDAAAALDPVPPAARSLSAVTWTMAAAARDFPLLRHSVFFSDAYEAEFREIFRDRRLPANPTVYVCAQDRADEDGPPATAPERLLVLVNAPPVGDTGPFPPEEIARCETATFAHLARCGLSLAQVETMRTQPAEFHTLFPATGGALYGQAVHGAMAPFRRPGNRTRLPGLYLAGGSVHPGAGVPTATLSGRIAAASLLADLSSARGSMSRSRPTAMRGGTSTR